ncbi:hypothetical protein BD410DRAFT_783907 [Rickenella mellea]|uniref:Uncharacterized protein n=1 Tax=Rickenella mellea TaxID=50990 RepID=A0A4Y7QFD2_9AGAM|nr:hypothetical protein BD410DRAFT_783907 [Rickenella mellea]
MSDGELHPVLKNANAASLPRQLWDWYISYLWSPRPDSWVYSIANTFRVLAVVLIAPFALLTLLDVTSYVIARTLGVIDSTKASTSDKRVHDNGRAVDGIPQSAPPSISADESDNKRTTSHGQTIAVTDTSARSERDSPPAYFFSPSEERTLKISGAGVFSPAVSRPSSPPTERRQRAQQDDSSAPSTTSSSPTDDGSYIMLGRDLSFGESSSFVRRRTGGESLEDSTQK